jgi:hypothetical protein
VVDKVQTGKDRQQCLFILFDGRARSGDTEDAIALSTVGPTSDEPHPKQMRREARDYGTDTVWFQYDLAQDKVNLINERIRIDLS